MSASALAAQLPGKSKQEMAESYLGQAMTERFKDGQWLLDAIRAPMEVAMQMMIDRWEIRLRAQDFDPVEYVQERPQSSESKFQDPEALEESRWVERLSRLDDWPYKGSHHEGMVDLSGVADMLDISFHEDGVNTSCAHDTKFVWFEHKNASEEDSDETDASAQNADEQDMKSKISRSKVPVSRNNNPWGPFDNQQWTGAANRTYYNTKAGFIGTFMSTSPAGLVPVNEMPALHFWSDIVFNVWKLLDPDIKAPRYVVRMAITNTDTKQAISHVCRDNPIAMMEKNPSKTEEEKLYMAPPWPGLTFSTDTPEGMLLLQTLHGKGVAWLLINHKKAFGLKYIDKIQVWQSKLLRDGKISMEESSPSMLFCVSE